MPDAISTYKSTNSFLECQKVHIRILQAYESDFGEYSEHVDKETRSRDLKPAIHLLTSDGLILPVFATTASGLPLHAHIQDHRLKLKFLDIGLLQTAAQVDAQDFFEKDILQINAGMLAKKFVAQEILANDLPN